MATDTEREDRVLTYKVTVTVRDTREHQRAMAMVSALTELMSPETRDKLGADPEANAIEQAIGRALTTPAYVKPDQATVEVERILA